jgi:transposase InsO family protein
LWHQIHGANFQRILQHFGIKDVATSVRNPQSNAVCKRLHQSVGNALHIFLSQAIPFNVTNVAKLVDSALIATALHASCAAIHCTLGMTPGAIIFNRDMFLNIPLLTYFHLLQTRRQAVIDDILRGFNQKQQQHDYTTINQATNV